jgi:hypothetical protein
MNNELTSLKVDDDHGFRLEILSKIKEILSQDTRLRSEN